MTLGIYHLAHLKSHKDRDSHQAAFDSTVKAESGILKAGRIDLAGDQRTAEIGPASADNHTDSGIAGTVTTGIAATGHREFDQADIIAGCNRSDTKSTEFDPYNLAAASLIHRTAIVYTTDLDCSIAAEPFMHSNMLRHSLID